MIARSAASNLSSRWKPRYPVNHCALGVDEPPRGRILVVEDQAIVALDLQRTLREARYRVVGPATTPSAVESLLARGTVDAAIVDADAGASAYAAADRVADAGVPILFLTSSPDTLPRQHAGGLVVAKPFAKPRLLEALEGILASRRIAEADDLPYPVAPPTSWPRVFPQL